MRNGRRCGQSPTRAPDELKTREAETGMRNGRGEADLRAQRRDHEGPRVEQHGAGANRGRQASATDAGLMTTQPEQGGRRPPWTPRKRCCRRPSREPEGTRRGYRLPSVLRLGWRSRPNVPGRCPGVERGYCRLVLRTNKRCPVLKRPPTARGHCNRRPVQASRAEGDPFYVVQREVYN